MSSLVKTTSVLEDLIDVMVNLTVVTNQMKKIVTPWRNHKKIVSRNDPNGFYLLCNLVKAFLLMLGIGNWNTETNFRTQVK